LEEKVDLGNLVLFPPESYVNKALEEVNFTIKEESSERKIDCDIADKTNNIKKEVIEPLEEVNFTIKEESSERKIDFDISGKTNNIKKEVIEPPVHEYEKTQIGFSTNSNVKCQTWGLEFGDKVVLKIHNSMVHPEEKKIDQNKIRKEDVIGELKSLSLGIEFSIISIFSFLILF
jgi:hypothetical protein